MIDRRWQSWTNLESELHLCATNGERGWLEKVGWNEGGQKSIVRETGVEANWKKNALLKQEIRITEMQLVAREEEERRRKRERKEKAEKKKR